jgi:nucleotide-binding universal stress UspA family protein
MFHKILVAVDLSVSSEAVFERALFLAKASRAPLGLFYVFSLGEEYEFSTLKLNMLEKYPYNAGEETTCYVGHPTLETLTTADSPVLSFLQSHVKKAAVEHVNSEFFICLGDQPGVAICAFAMNWQADLIVLGHRGRSGLSELLLGSVSNHVVHHAPCSVHVVKRKVRS